MYKIAIIEDSKAVNNALAEFCRQLDQSAEVDQFFDRASAETGIKQNDYSLIVVDIELPPEKNAGIGLINVNSQYHKSPVIVVSGLDSSVYRSIMYQLDIWDFLEKPIAPDGQMFLAAAMRVLRDTRNSQGAQSAQGQQAESEEDLFVDHETGKASFKGKPLNIPHTAKIILQKVYKNKGGLVAYEELFELVKSGKNNDAIRQHVKTIRDALKEVGASEGHVEVIRMKGVRWQD
ncbi:DNA-binding response regulator, OmpR family, contains REC and winged-helix (wHTH) domain [Pseudomonas sp. NFACC23-1]|uniref:response regulator transcription factor n=1 Tax=unclassified Pseudomonas TaxID=196821 RepID=UPI00088A1E2D|nr:MULTISPECIES: response regulator [unclassified Pseudomonas]SDB28844.1 DNA-binding response regulator, OmpR family, contains REC and winged-helix (wHTH) domain [Pseudomonas sp. NFACC17-2]SEJ42336.1 DNA-binding response regulator, OmpR family, contains REC and winged-helix (wHTH) domain [Pseudomonas sp. NFACC23-1]SFW67246.1 DNA-binding response regulator, OmpR family, contains REC and winged-helix (wHTH) domain [Pseudomonas sp. NFACC16-2]